MERRRLDDLVIRFPDAFTRDDLEGVMAFRSEDAVCEEVGGRRNRVKARVPLILEEGEGGPQAR